MGDKEYTYDIGKYTIGVDENGEDGIGMTIAIIKNGGIYFLGNCYGENARCIDLLIKENKQLKEKYENAIADYEETRFEKEQLNSLVNSCQEEIRRLKKQLEEKNKPQIFIDTQDMEERYSEGLYQDYLEEENKKYKNQQKEFIEYMNKTIKELECDDFGDEEMKGYLIQRIDTFKEILQKYKEIIGVSDEKEN